MATEWPYLDSTSCLHTLTPRLLTSLSLLLDRQVPSSFSSPCFSAKAFLSSPYFNLSERSFVPIYPSPVSDITPRGFGQAPGVYGPADPSRPGPAKDPAPVMISARWDADGCLRTKAPGVSGSGNGTQPRIEARPDEAAADHIGQGPAPLILNNASGDRRDDPRRNNAKARDEDGSRTRGKMFSAPGSGTRGPRAGRLAEFGKTAPPRDTISPAHQGRRQRNRRELTKQGADYWPLNHSHLSRARFFFLKRIPSRVPQFPEEGGPTGRPLEGLAA